MSTPMVGLVDGLALGIEVAGIRHAPRSHENACNINEDIAKKIRSDQHVKLRWVLDQFVGG